LTEVNDYVNLFDVDEDEIGLVMGPRIHGETGELMLEINVRMLEEQEDGLYGIDGTYTYEGVTVERFHRDLSRRD